MGKKILVIDDDPICLKLMEKILSKANYDVTAASGPAEGFKKATAVRPDLIILDVMMPEISGLELVKIIQGKEDLKEIPLVVMSAKENMKEHFEAMNVAGFLLKGGDLSGILSLVKGVLGEPEAESAEEEGSSTQVLLVGTDQYIVDKVKAFLNEKKIPVYVAVDENDAIENVPALRPKLVLSQFFEDAEKFDAVKIYRSMEASPKTKSILFMAFCPKNVELEAMQSFGDRVLSYGESKELVEKLNPVLEGIA